MAPSISRNAQPRKSTLLARIDATVPADPTESDSAMSVSSIW
jgi:hypothetical protein